MVGIDVHQDDGVGAPVLLGPRRRDGRTPARAGSSPTGSGCRECRAQPVTETIVLLGFSVSTALISGATRSLAPTTWLRNHRYDPPPAASSSTNRPTNVQRTMRFHLLLDRPSTAYTVYGLSVSARLRSAPRSSTRPPSAVPSCSGRYDRVFETQYRDVVLLPPDVIGPLIGSHDGVGDPVALHLLALAGRRGVQPGGLHDPQILVGDLALAGQPVDDLDSRLVLVCPARCRMRPPSPAPVHVGVSRGKIAGSHHLEGRRGGGLLPQPAVRDLVGVGDGRGGGRRSWKSWCWCRSRCRWTRRTPWSGRSPAAAGAVISWSTASSTAPSAGIT